MAQIFAIVRDFDQVQRYAAQYSGYFAGVIDLSQGADEAGLTTQLSALSVPDPNEGQDSWQNFAGRLQLLLAKERNFDFERQISSEQIDKLNAYFNANELLIKCLDLAVVSDRDGVRAGLLRGPKTTADR